jgi:hypothetical protein
VELDAFGFGLNGNQCKFALLTLAHANLSRSAHITSMPIAGHRPCHNSSIFGLLLVPSLFSVSFLTGSANVLLSLSLSLSPFSPPGESGISASPKDCVEQRPAYCGARVSAAFPNSEPSHEGSAQLKYAKKKKESDVPYNMPS